MNLRKENTNLNSMESRTTARIHGSNRICPSGHFSNGVEMMILLLGYQIFCQTCKCPKAFVLVTLSVWLVIGIWLFVPLICHAHAFVVDWNNWKLWLRIRGNAGIPSGKSWESWWEEEDKYLHYSAKHCSLAQSLLLVRFFFYKYGPLRHHSKIAENDQSFMILPKKEKMASESSWSWKSLFKMKKLASYRCKSLPMTSVDGAEDSSDKNSQFLLLLPEKEKKAPRFHQLWSSIGSFFGKKKHKINGCESMPTASIDKVEEHPSDKNLQIAKKPSLNSSEHSKEMLLLPQEEKTAPRFDQLWSIIKSFFRKRKHGTNGCESMKIASINKIKETSDKNLQIAKKSSSNPSENLNQVLPKKERKTRRFYQLWRRIGNFLRNKVLASNRYEFLLHGAGTDEISKLSNTNSQAKQKDYTSTPLIAPLLPSIGSSPEQGQDLGASKLKHDRSDHVLDKNIDNQNQKHEHEQNTRKISKDQDHNEQFSSKARNFLQILRSNTESKKRISTKRESSHGGHLKLVYSLFCRAQTMKEASTPTNLLDYGSKFAQIRRVGGQISSSLNKMLNVKVGSSTLTRKFSCCSSKVGFFIAISILMFVLLIYALYGGQPRWVAGVLESGSSVWPTIRERVPQQLHLPSRSLVQIGLLLALPLLMALVVRNGE